MRRGLPLGRAFAQLDWSSDTIVEDMDCTIQVHRKKLGKIVYQKHAVVSTQDPRTLRDYVKQMYRWHTGAWQVGLKYGMLTGLSKIDLEYKLLMGEGVIFATLFLLLPVWLVLYPRLAFYGVGMDMIVLIFLSMICGDLRSAHRCLPAFAAVSAVALRGLFRLSIQLLESSGSEETGQRLVCSQTVLTRKVEL